MTIAKGFKYKRPTKSLKKLVNETFNISVEIKRVVQNIYTGAEMMLIKPKTGISKYGGYIMFSSEDIATYDTYEKAKKAFNKYISVEGELI